MKVAEIRIPRLFKQLEEDQYPYDFLPVMISGLRSDNGPPNVAILDQVNLWNDAHGDEIRVEMTTLDQFFQRLRADEADIQTHQGDWPDWWTDGAASMPDATALFRNAQRQWLTLRQLQSGKSANDFELMNNLAAYAEHTYGHAASIVKPHDSGVLALAARKRAYAAIANEEAQTLLATELASRGMARHQPDLPLRYRVINPGPMKITDVARLQIEHHEFYEKFVYQGVQVLDEESGKVLPAGIDPTPVTTTVFVPLTLEPGQEKILLIQPTHSRDITPDKGMPALETREIGEPAGVFETDTFIIDWDVSRGITRWIEISTGRDFLREDLEHSAFMPVSSLTPMESPDDSWSVRGDMGLSRSGENARWSVGKITAVRELFTGVAPADPLDDPREDQRIPMYQRLELDMEIAGCSECTLVLEATVGLPRIDVSFNVNKQNN